MNPDDQMLESVANEKGTYVLFIELSKPSVIRIGKLGKGKFPSGLYAYVGSAIGPGGLRARISRHLRDKKKFHWHIDYFLKHSKVVDVFTTRRRCEKKIARKLLNTGKCAMKGFGSSDDDENESHLIYFSSMSVEEIKKILSQII